MTLLATEYSTEIERETDFCLTRIRQIDKILAGPVKTLIELGGKGSSEDNDIQKLFYFPTWISEVSESEKKDYLLTQSVCCATLQRLCRLRRRFSWLDKDSDKQLQDLHEKLALIFSSKKRLDFTQSVKLLESETFGGLNPLTASQVFRVLMEAGEDRTHAGMGFLAFFAIVWPLCRSFPDPLTIGIRVEPWEVTAYGTAKCVIPIKILQKVTNTRAQLFENINDNLVSLQKLAKQRTARKRWEFNVQLDELGANLWHLSKYSIDRKAFKTCAREVGKESAPESSNEEIYHDVVKEIGIALVQVRKTSKEVWRAANKMVDNISQKIWKRLETMAKRRVTKPERSNALKQLTDLGLRFSEEHVKDRAYWLDLADSAEKALGYCGNALKVLEAACDICPGIGNDFASIAKPVVSKALLDLATANRKIGKVMDEPVKDAARWCRKVVDREIAHASAENLTDFDPSELVSAIAVAVSWNLMTTNLQVSDAVKKAIAGARIDGSWRPGKPFYSPNYAFGIWAGTSDIVWTLTSAIEQFPDVTEADEEIFNYVNWLERTQVTLIPNPPEPKPQPDKIPNKRPSNGIEPREKPYVGWASERLRDRRKINLGTTAFSINALLEIRDLVEYRLWQLCKRRFSVVSIDKLLKEIDPVDLGAWHSKRLHWHLAHMAHETQGPNYQTAEYSLLLHGPPGSSKTKMAEALSAEMWKSSGRWGPSEARLLRITPADFTRLGEDRLDSEARVIFDLISGVRAVTILFDEIDDLLRDRNSRIARRFPPRFMDLVVPAMLNRLGDLRSACRRQEICFLLGTNYVERIEPALIRKGRIDRCVAVVYPDLDSRLAMIGRHADRIRAESKERKDSEDREALKGIAVVIETLADHIASETKQWPWMTLDETSNEISEKLKTTVKKMLENGEPLRRVLRKSDSPLKKIIDNILNSNRSSFSEPEYDIRRWRGRFSQQLLDEYLHHLMSKFDDPTKCGKYLEEEAKKLKHPEKYWHKGIKFVKDRLWAIWEEREKDLR